MKLQKTTCICYEKNITFIILRFNKKVSMMKMEEIKQKYEGKWILIEYTKLRDDLSVIEGEVIAHSMDKDFIYKEQLRYKNKNLSIEYLGTIPQDWAVRL